MPMYFEFEVSMRGVSPRIWRRFLLEEKATFEDLHFAIQDSSCWRNYKSYLFRVEPGDRVIARRDVRIVADKPKPLGKNVLVRSFFTINGGSPPVTACVYVCASEIPWVLDVVLIKQVRTVQRNGRSLLSGEHAFPREGYIGTRLYETRPREIEEAKKSDDPLWQDSDGMLYWLDGWRPEEFDLLSTRERFNR